MVRGACGESGGESARWAGMAARGSGTAGASSGELSATTSGESAPCSRSCSAPPGLDADSPMLPPFISPWLRGASRNSDNGADRAYYTTSSHVTRKSVQGSYGEPRETPGVDSVGRRSAPAKEPSHDPLALRRPEPRAGSGSADAAVRARPVVLVGGLRVATVAGVDDRGPLRRRVRADRGRALGGNSPVGDGRDADGRGENGRTGPWSTAAALCCAVPCQVIHGGALPFIVRGRVAQYASASTERPSLTPLNHGGYGGSPNGRSGR